MSADRAVFIALLALAAGGCASVPRAWLPAPAPVVSPAVPTADQLAMPYRARAEHLEHGGQLRQAVEAWITALSLAPEHGPSRRALKRLRERIDREVVEQVRRGWHALARGAPAEARQRFLAALFLDPDSRAAQEALGAASAPPALEVGTGTSRLPAVTSAPSPPAPAAGPGSAPRSISESSPEVLYTAAKAHLAARSDEAAYQALRQLVRVSPGYRDSATLLRSLSSRVARQRYQEGLRLFREERLEDAMEQWRGVLEIDPDHAEAGRNIEQAEKMLRTLAVQQKR